jgi:hypothetical protein
MPLNNLIDDILKSIETNLVAAQLHADMLPYDKECVQSFKHHLSDLIHEYFEDLKDRISQDM